MLPVTETGAGILAAIARDFARFMMTLGVTIETASATTMTLRAATVTGSAITTMAPASGLTACATHLQMRMATVSAITGKAALCLTAASGQMSRQILRRRQISKAGQPRATGREVPARASTASISTMDMVITGSIPGAIKLWSD